MDVTLTIHSVEGAREVPLAGNRLTLGRTDAADVVINDSSLSRIHASINRDGDRVWIVDEGSTNGTAVNGTPVPAEGTPLRDRDEVYLGHTTVVINLGPGDSPDAVEETVVAAQDARRLPLTLIAASAGIVVIVLAAIIVGLAYRPNDSERITVRKYDSPSDNQTPINNDSNNTSSPPASPVNSPDVPDETSQRDVSVTTARLYRNMSADEKRQFIASEAQHVSRMIGNREGYAFTPEVVNKIMSFVNTYSARVNSPRPSGGGCTMRHDLTTLLNRARTYAPAVVKAFNEKGLSPQVGIYLAMIEAEYCPCLSSGTGPKGYFQFASSTARRYGVQDVSSPSDRRPDDRCKIDIMAPVAAQYMKDLITMFGTGPMSVPLAIASYNEGEGGISANLMKALNAARTSDNPERSFWTLVAHEEILSEQFQRENIKYVPKFFGAAIVGENPRVFGVDLLPISAYAQQRQGSTTADR